MRRPPRGGCARHSRCGAAFRWLSSASPRSRAARRTGWRNCALLRSRRACRPTLPSDVTRRRSGSWRACCTSIRTASGWPSCSCTRCTRPAASRTRWRPTAACTAAWPPTSGWSPDPPCDAWSRRCWPRTRARRCRPGGRPRAPPHRPHGGSRAWSRPIARCWPSGWTPSALMRWWTASRRCACRRSSGTGGTLDAATARAPSGRSGWRRPARTTRDARCSRRASCAARARRCAASTACRSPWASASRRATRSSGAGRHSGASPPGRRSTSPRS